MVSDLLTIDGDDEVTGEPLIRSVMRAGKAISARPSLNQCRDHAAVELGRLPDDLRRLEDHAADYQASVSDRLRELAREVDRKMADTTHRGADNTG